MKLIPYGPALTGAAALLLAGVAIASAQPTPAPAETPPAAEAPAEAPAEVDPAVLEAMVEAGGSVYHTNCQACHGNEGQGGGGPALAGYTLLENSRTVIRQIVYGGAYMPAFDRLTNEQIANVATYIRNSFGNEYGIVTVEDVEANR